MKLRQTLPTAIMTALAATLLVGMPAAVADGDTMKQGFADYNAGHYSEAMDHLQGALTSEFNNAKLHYYLANTYIHLNLKDAGIREFRIAYALEPDKEVGKLAHQALLYLGAESDKSKDVAKEAERKAPSDPLLDKITATLQQQAESAKSSSRAGDDAIARDIARRTSEQLDRAKSDMQRDNSYYRRGRLIQLPLPDDALRQLDSLKQIYDANKNAYNDGSARHSDELQKSADNLTGLLNDKTKGAAPHLVPAGTNLYIRNYNSGTSPSPSAPPTTAPASSAGGNSAAAHSAGTAAPSAAPSAPPAATTPASPAPKAASPK